MKRLQDRAVWFHCSCAESYRTGRAFNQAIYTRSRMNQRRPNRICLTRSGRNTGRGTSAMRLCKLRDSPLDVEGDRNLVHSFRTLPGMISTIRQKHCY
jgi:hypothetical protein